jgi:hypothetical protein
MIAESIGFVLRNLPAFLLVIALLAAAQYGGPGYRRDCIRVVLVQPPIQGGSGLGVVDLPAGDAIGHVHQMLVAGNFAPGNAGVRFFMDIICPVLAIALLAAAWRPYRAGMVLRRSV